MKIYTVGLALTATLLFCNQETCQAEETGRVLAQKLQKHKKNHKKHEPVPVNNDEILYDYVEDQDCIPELEAVLQPDGTYVYEDTHNCDNGRLLAKKSSKKSSKKPVKKQPKKSRKKPSKKPCSSQDNQDDQEPSVAPEDEAWYDYVEDQDCIPELEAVLQPDGTYVYEDTHNCDNGRLLAKKSSKKSSKKPVKKPTKKPSKKPVKNQDDQEPPVAPDDEILYDYVEDQDCIPELEAVLQADGTYVYEDTHNCDNGRLLAKKTSKKQAKKQPKKSNKKNNKKPSKKQDDQEPPVAPEDEILYDYVETQDCIPELEAVLQADGTYVYEEVNNC